MIRPHCCHQRGVECILCPWGNKHMQFASAWCTKPFVIITALSIHTLLDIFTPAPAASSSWITRKCPALQASISAVVPVCRNGMVSESSGEIMATHLPSFAGNPGKHVLESMKPAVLLSPSLHTESFDCR